ncbi:acyl-CoA dehydrogenase family protein [Mycolicibacterium fluoranthenivorans]|uniref:Alkylation response protein AidB-like acyl-CoA dehydrogenase n=1 Tax=Mycolicibacterium fluoranthenivorans TaxID=258505 RepID=A0A7X5U2R8_9MYCO|nr:acyl-CoA dehydrogenase [Mycolicibacterium fluoranthenivorans]MCV7354113.1 acyl-CoA dehydrogenase family protein [Mycolicibacterium fluoranthenivorans]NIH97324.1 alkylation response protein AidB-like acyl-CoA dehydrogenase [Mycolicibacterium fluoranthenivorans]
MDLMLSDEQRQLVDSFGALFERESPSERIRASEPVGFDPQLWTALSGTGAVEMAVAENSGGWGADEVDLALVAEQLGRVVASAPLIEAQVAARILAAGGDAGADVLPGVLSGDRLVTFAPRAYGDVRHLRLVPGGAVADAVVAMVGGRLMYIPISGMRTRVDNLGSLPLADIEIGSDAHVLAVGPTAHESFSGAVDLWLTLTASAMVGAANRALAFGVEYAKQRQAFGTLIGGFQAVAHPLADSATAIDGARLLALRAACSFTEESSRTTELAAMAFAFAYETARDATYRSLHVHGGYGFGMEGDVQLYYRRIRGWAMVFGAADTALDRAADARYGARSEATVGR